MDKNLNKPHKGLHTDNHPSEQPKESYRFALNAVNESAEGNQTHLSNEPSNYACTNIPEGYYIIGDKYMEDNQSALFLLNPSLNKQEIGVLNKDNIYRTLINTSVLDFNIGKQIDCTYRTRGGGERILYWVDGYNRPRAVDINNLENYYTQAYKVYLAGGGNPNTYVLEKYDALKFELVKNYRDIPVFSNIEILNSGSIDSGSYNISIRLIDSDFNSTEWITTSNTVNIYVDSITSQFKDIEGSRNIKTDYQFFEKANKSIKVTFSNLDSNYQYYQVAIIKSTNNEGKVNQILVSDRIPVNQNYFIYSGQDTQMTETTLVDVMLDRTIIEAPQHIEQIENRLLLANGRDTNYNWCELQRYASKIKTDVAYKEVILNSVTDVANPKNGTSAFVFRGYMPGEVYSMGIVYLMEDGSLSPVFHIPGVPATGANSDMVFYEGTSKYNNIHSCNGTVDYWGDDYNGNPLLGENVRQHKFPFRTDVNKPLFTNTNQAVNVTKYLISITVDLLPPATFPANTSIIINYNLSGLGIQSITIPITAADMGVPITIYDDVYEPLLMPGSPDYLEVDSTSDILQYQTPTITPDTFTIALGTPTPYASTETVADAVTSEIFGFEFSNIEKPTGVIGYYIVRAEKSDEDKVVIDNAIVGPTTTYNNYIAFGKFYPDIFSTTNALNPVVNGIQNLINNVGSYTQPQTNDLDSAYIHSPEHQYFNKKQQFDKIKLEGEYIWGRAYYPFAHPNVPGNGNTPKYGSNLNGIKGQLFLDAVQAGTLIDTSPSAAKFNVQCGYKIETFNFNIDNGDEIEVEDTLYIDATDSVTKGDKIYFNASGDNKIGITRFGDGSGEAVVLEQTTAYDSDPIYENRIPKSFKLKYAALIRDKINCYDDFFTRNYYKEQNNPMLFGGASVINNHKIFNGDASIGASHLVNTHYWSQVVGNGLGSGAYQIISGIFAIVGGVIVAAATGSTTLGTLLIGYGVSSITSGIKISKMQAMMDTHYAAGLKKAITDVLTSCLFPNTTPNNQTIWQWYSEQCKNIWVESYVNVSLRSGLGFSFSDFINAPDENFIAVANVGTYNTYLSYLTEKLTVLDTQTGAGRLYKGYAGAEFYDMNLDYLRFNKEKIFIHLPIEYNCCGDNSNFFSNRIWYSEQSFQEELSDNYRKFLPNNYRDIEGENGEITDLHKIGNSLFIHTKEALWQLPQNIQEQVTTEFVTQIGTGEFFSIPPKKIVDDNLGSGGTKHKWSKVKTKYGVPFISEIENKIYMQGEGLKDISTDGNRNWFENNLKGFLVQQIYELTGTDYPFDNNPANPLGVGYLSCYDTRYERILFTKKDYSILYPDAMLVDETPDIGELEGAVLVYNTQTGGFEIYSPLGITQVVSFDNHPEFFENKSWTISYSFHTNTWVSYHSYLPNYYIHNQSNFYSFKTDNNNIWKHNLEGSYQTFYDTFYPHIIEYVSVSNPIQTRIFDDITFITEARKYDSTLKQYADVEDVTHNKIILYNSKQSSGEQTMIVKDTEAIISDYLLHQTINNPGEILIDRNERDWSINQLRDYVTDYTKPLFSQRWSDKQSEYFIDKVPNTSIIDFNKSWSELQSFRDKFLIIRLKFDNFADVNLITQYTIETENKSER